MLKISNAEQRLKPRKIIRVSLTFTSQVGRFNSLVWHRLGLVFGTKLSVRSSSAVCVRGLDVERPPRSHRSTAVRRHGGSKRERACYSEIHKANHICGSRAPPSWEIFFFLKLSRYDFCSCLFFPNHYYLIFHDTYTSTTTTTNKCCQLQRSSLPLVTRVPLVTMFIFSGYTELQQFQW